MKTSFVALSLFSLMLATTGHAQTARKPSSFEAGKKEAATRIKTQVPALHRLSSQGDFNQLSRVYEQDTDYEIPHVIFLIDLKDDKRIDYINTPKYSLHETYLAQVKGFKPNDAQLKSYYYSPERHYIFGTISWQNTNKEFVYEFWEGDKITPSLLKTADQVIKSSFFAPIRYKTNSTWQEEVATQTKLPFVTQESLIKDFPYLSLHQGKATGTLRVIEKEDDLYDVGPGDIIILKVVPLVMPPVAAVISEKPSTALSHVNVLARGWGIPNVYLKDAEKILAPYIGKRISLNAADNQYQVSLATSGSSTSSKPSNIKLPSINTSDLKLRALNDLRQADHVYCGSKAANLGQINAQIKAANVPDGFCIPFGYYQQFMQQLGIDSAYLQNMEAGFKGNNRERRAGLLALQQKIQSAPVPQAWQDAWAAQWQQQLHEQGVFVRSSSNSEDLPNFSGAGLYTTIPNVKSKAALVDAVKQSWASVFNYSAYEARRIAGLPHDSVKMSTFVQQGINADLSGVLVTLDPYDASRKNVSYIAAKRGVGIRVVEGKRLAEQLVYNHRVGSIQLISSSNETTALQLDDKGGVKEVPIDTGKRVMSDAEVKTLANTGSQIKALFGNKQQDIEWAFANKRLVILQARPYLTR
ncbi:phosphoenolpyruvate synthase [Vitreoscilla massiliensis]|uniref:Phosphoenolpyruvate synthase n=1 Tax=Vitreoscilla massiliensis TaxID=1689272 RepID=A0ABY4E3W1_9NEIS|nr:PEP/pyruvate-binding domain-containing protein [Vitreoscilla massiliensis]UOO89974.1 phosphoenolpyruvate synthase [Vitreoscilla massiliensis]